MYRRNITWDTHLFRLHQWKFLYVNILSGGKEGRGVVKWVAAGERCQLGGKGGVRRCCGMEWLIIASRHPRVLVEWIKGWKKEWKPFHAFTDQSQDHVFRAIPSPFGTRDMHHPAIHFPDLCVCSCRCRGDRICKLCAKGMPLVARFIDPAIRWYQFSGIFTLGLNAIETRARIQFDNLHNTRKTSFSSHIN